MKCINKVILVGRAGREAEIKTTANGRAVAHFSLATETFWKKKDLPNEFQSKTEWHRIVAWGEMAEKIKRQVYKGAKVYVEGVIKYGKYNDKSGAEKQSTEVEIYDFSLLGTHAPSVQPVITAVPQPAVA